MAVLAASALQLGAGMPRSDDLWMHHFMGIFLLIFSMVKLFDLKGFAKGFARYDVLARSLDQRRHTIQRIAQAIVTHQKDFFELGPTFLGPLKMAQIAADVQMHESTVSRTVCGKFATTPHGVFELRSFFTSSIETTSGGVVSNRRLESCLQTLIKNEDPSAPYTDNQLVGELAAEGISICRRTVVKYRDKLRILPSALRRRGAAVRSA
jgi:RNA polymerase sigma-54 factor